jgi:hypothetical protein
LRLVPLPVVAAVALVLAAPAAAKELTKAKLCGPVGCAVVTDPGALRDFPTGGETVASPPSTSAYYALAISSKDDVATHTWTIYYVPDANMLAIPDSYGGVTWHPLFGNAIRYMKSLASRAEPYRAPAITSVAIGDRVVSDGAASYLRLFDASLGTSPGRASPSDWVPVDFRSSRPSPWTLGPRELMYSPSENVLERRTTRVLLPAGVAADLEAGRPLVEEGVRWLPSVVLAGIVAVLMVFAGLAALVRRVGATPSTEPV